MKKRGRKTGVSCGQDFRSTRRRDKAVYSGAIDLLRGLSATRSRRSRQCILDVLTARLEASLSKRIAAESAHRNVSLRLYKNRRNFAAIWSLIISITPENNRVS